MRGSESECPVCRRKDIKAKAIASAVQTSGWSNRSHSDSAIFFDCPACGEFVVTEMDCVNLKSPRSQWTPNHLSALLREQTIRRLPRFWLRDGMEPYGPLELSKNLAPIDVNELLERWPRTVPERIDRTLCNLARLSPTGGHDIKLDPNDTALAFAQTAEEARYHINALRLYGLLDGKIHVDLTPSNFTLTPNGWARFEELTHGASAPENPVFVAMWFGGEDEKSQMDEVFQKGIQPAIEQAGYLVTRVDLAEHNDWIMDKVLGDIRLAPFLVADFTRHRNGVYFEAAFARGLGTPVIHTCQREDFGKAHFDTVQLNHVLWDTPEVLRTKLYHRIVGTIGRGPHPPRSGPK